jgi:hypothetical protein
MIKIEELETRYWYKTQLVEIARKLKLPTYGSKNELYERIKLFIDKGLIDRNKVTYSRSLVPKTITLNTMVEKNFRCTYFHRDFFKTIIPNFKLSVDLQNWIKTNPNITYGDIINQYKHLMNQKRMKKGTTVIGSQFQFMRYNRDFFNDPKNKNRTKSDCIKCWKYKKSKNLGRVIYELADLSILDS